MDESTLAMNQFRKRTLLFGTLAVLLLLTVACQPTRAAFEITNDSGIAIDFIYSEDFIDFRDFGRNYDALEIGDVDTYQGCTQCGISPGAVYRFEEPFSDGQTVVMAAREAESNRMIFIMRYTWQELFDQDWKVSVVDQRPRAAIFLGGSKAAGQIER